MTPHMEQLGRSEPAVTLPPLFVAIALVVAWALLLPANAAGQVALTPPAAPRTASAPSPAGLANTPVYVAIPDVFPPLDARALVVREPGIDLIFLRDGEADLDALTMALHVLRDARVRLPAPPSGVLIPITGFVTTTAVPKGVSTRLTEALRRLSSAEPVDLGSLGRGRQVRLSGR